MNYLYIKYIRTVAEHIKNLMVLLLYVVFPVNVCNDSRIMNDLTAHTIYLPSM